MCRQQSQNAPMINSVFGRVEKEKIIVTSTFSFFNCFSKAVRYRIKRYRVKLAPIDSFLQHDNLKPFPNKPWFSHVCSSSLLKTQWEKEKLLATSNFSFSHSIFYLFKELSAIFIKFKIVVCKHFELEGPKIYHLGKG